MQKESYQLIDSGAGRKLEQFGNFLISRPASQAVWKPSLDEKNWEKADAIFTREPDNRWVKKIASQPSWTINVSNINFKISPTDFGHLGIFPEQKESWQFIQNIVSKASEPRVLNLFAYSGGSTLAAAKAGAHVCHLDASKGMVTWARENAALNKLENAPIRWIVDDVHKFLERELRRGNRYEGIILDPPTFGRGSKGELFKIEDDINNLLQMCRELLSDKPLFFLFSCHTPGFTPIVMEHLLNQTLVGLKGQTEAGEMTLTGQESTLALPSGTYARWWREI